MFAQLKRGYQVARDAAGWRPSNLRLLTYPYVDRERNRRSGLIDQDHLLAAAEWIERAQDATGDGGVSGRYSLRRGWTSSYPETTGYLVPTLIHLSDTLREPRYRARARRAIDFLLSVQLPSGAFPGMEIAANRTEPSIFNSAQIVCGLRAWHSDSKDPRALDAMRRACDWLVAQQDPDGAWRRFIYGNVAYTYMAHAACWIAEAGAYLDRTDYLDAARRHLEWVLKHQDRETRWFDLCGFSEEEHRLRRGPTHTIAYTIWGVLMTSCILRHEAGIQAARSAALGVARRLELSRWLPGVLDHRWRGCAPHACLTGNAQMALIWLELHRLFGDPMLVSAACKAIDLVKRAQPMSAGDPGILGGIPGSDPVWGDYLYMRIPNWAAKFFVDALIEKKSALERLAVPPMAAPVLPEGLPAAIPARPAAQATPGPRAVLYASPSTHKIAEMLGAWSKWGFRPAAVVVSRDPPRSTLRHLLDKLRDEGLGTVARRLFGRRNRSAPTASAPSGHAPMLPPVEYCRAMNIDVIETGPLDSEDAIRAVRALEPDVAIHAGAGILRSEILAVPRLGTLNAHMGILPRQRGMNVSEWARLLGEPVGCSVHLIDPGIDTGEIVCCRTVPIAGARSIAELRALVNEAQIALLGEVVRYVCETGKLPPRRAQRAEEGRQYFVMHPELRAVLEGALRA